MSKIHQIGDFGCKKNHQNLNNTQNINIYSLVPQTNHSVALWFVSIFFTTLIREDYFWWVFNRYV